MSTFAEALKRDIARSDRRESLKAVAAMADSDNDNDSAEIDRLKRIKDTAVALNKERADSRLTLIANLAQQAIDQENSEEPAGS